MADPGWIGIKMRLEADFGGQVIRDIVQFASACEPNAIPQAALTLAVGRNVENQKPASIHGELLTKLKERPLTKIYLTATKHGGDNLKDPIVDVGRFQIWEGRTAGHGWTRNRGEAAYVVHLTHWLEELNNSSAVSATTHPSSPANLATAAAYPGLSLSETAAGAAAGWVPLIDADGDLSGDLLTDDLWMRVLHPLMTLMAKQDRIDYEQLGGRGVGRGGNEAALAALERMRGTSKYSKKLAMDLNGADGLAVSDGMRNALTKETGASWVHTTLWGKLVGEWAPSYFFVVVPRVTDALVVPFTGSLKTEFKTIKASDYTHLSDITPNTQKLQAVGIWHSCYSEAGSDGMVFPERTASMNRIAGWFPHEQPETGERGVVLLKEAPRWLQDAVSPSVFSYDSIGGDDDVGTGHVAAPGNGAPPPGEKKDAKDTIESSYTLLDAYAQQWYSLESLKGHTAELSGRLRFDIAPGSTVKIEPAGEKFVQPDLTAVPLFASVARVSIVINPEARRAGTSFTLAHLRTEAENNDPKFALSKPPLYKEAWKGAPLLDVF